MLWDFGRRYEVISTWERSWPWYVNEGFEYMLDKVESTKVGFFVMIHLDDQGMCSQLMIKVIILAISGGWEIR
jgi:hypothetical protein